MALKKVVLSGISGGAIFSVLDFGYDYKMKVEFDLTNTIIQFLIMSIIFSLISLLNRKQADKCK